MSGNIKFFEGQGDLGPADLKDARCPMILLAGYKHLGNSGLTVDKWRDQYHPKIDPNGPDVDKNRKWDWPDYHGYKDGFLTDEDGKPIQTTVTLGEGMLLDRFGGDGTAFFCPFGTPFALRSLPGCLLLTEYVVYRVLKPFEATSGPAKPWFGQPGLCLQLKAVKYESAQIMLGGKDDKGVDHEPIIRRLTKSELENLYAGKFE